MRRWTIQLRLTAWYFFSASLVVTIFAAGSWFAMRTSMYRALDRDLRYQIAAVVPFVESHALNTRERFTRIFADDSDSPILGAFIQISDDRQQLLYQSEILRTHRIPLLPAASPDGAVAIAAFSHRAWPIRFANRHIAVEGIGLNVHVVQPLREVQNSLHAYVLSLTVLAPLALLLTTALGYWMSRRALTPVEQIRKDAESIDPADLTARLPVPPNDDELTRLARTLNAMLSRIEIGFRSVQQFTADASHELRAPLALITTAADVSLRRERTSEELVESLRKVQREARHMSALVDNLLALARGDAQKIALAESIDLGELLRELVQELMPSARAKGLVLELNLPGRLVFVMGLGTELRRLFLILLDNAIKYTENGSIVLILTASDRIVEVSVTDTGIGIDPFGQLHVFDRFWRADKVRTRSEGGTGLGLALALQIVQRHGGSIALTSEPGQGSTFAVKLTPYMFNHTIQPENGNG